MAAGPLGNIFSRRSIPRESGVTNELFYSSISVQYIINEFRCYEAKIEESEIVQFFS